jgi:hypothetical protein
MRHLANVLAVQARLDIKRGDWKSAQERLQTGYALARHLGRGETLIESLVGIGIAQIMNRVLDDWISEPGSPNLYWALSNLPMPFSDMRRAMSFEREFVYFTLPALKEMRAGRYSVASWQQMVGQATEAGGLMSVVSGGGNPGYPAALGAPSERAQLFAAGAGLLLYPEAKRYLVARGKTAAEVEAMPVAEALGRYFVESWEAVSDDMYKWMGLPPAQAAAGLEEWQKEFEAAVAANQINPLARMLLPSLSRAVQLNTALDRRIGALRLVEAVRSFAAEKGKLPEKMEELGLPLPVDPLGAGYTLRREGEAVVIEAVAWRGAVKPPSREMNIRYEVRLRRG